MPGVEIKGSFWASFGMVLTQSSLFVNWFSSMPTHPYFHSIISKKFFLKKIKIINDILNLN